MTTTETNPAAREAATLAGQDRPSVQMSTAQVHDPAVRPTQAQKVFTAIAATLMVGLIAFGVLGLMGYIRV